MKTLEEFKNKMIELKEEGYGISGGKKIVTLMIMEKIWERMHLNFDYHDLAGKVLKMFTYHLKTLEEFKNKMIELKEEGLMYTFLIEYLNALRKKKMRFKCLS